MGNLFDQQIRRITMNHLYRQTSNISRTLVDKSIVGHSDVVGAAPRCSNCIFILDITPGFNGLYKNNSKFFGFRASNIRDLTVYQIYTVKLMETCRSDLGLEIITLEVFGAVDEQHASCVMVHL